MSSELSGAINNAVLLRLAGRATYNLGRGYFDHGHVESVSEEAEGIRALVRGAKKHEVRLSADEGILDYSCDCPAGSEGNFCGHCVAAALDWSARSQRTGKKPRKARRKKVSIADAGNLLLLWEKEALVNLVLKWAGDDDLLRQRLLLLAAKEREAGLDTAPYRAVLGKAIRTGKLRHWHETWTFTQNVNEAINSIEPLLDDGHAYAMIELCEFALTAFLRRMERVDDIDNHLSAICDRLQALHLRACAEARPEPVALAKRLLKQELSASHGFFRDAVTRYADILGTDGIAAYRELAEKEWAAVPVVTKAELYSYTGEHSRITHVMETLARHSGDVDALVAVLSRDLSHPSSFLRTAEACREFGRHDQAIEWAKRGLEIVPKYAGGELREFLADEYQHQGRHEEALNLIWKAFSDGCSFGPYCSLERHAKQAGVWPDWRSRALAAIRRDIKERQHSAIRAEFQWLTEGDNHSRLVRIFLHEGDTGTARREATEGGCSLELWRQLAATLEQDHPADCVAIYLEQADAAVARASNFSYREAVDLLADAAAVMHRIDRDPEFRRSLEAIRTKYWRRRNFISLLEDNAERLHPE